MLHQGEMGVVDFQIYTFNFHLDTHTFYDTLISYNFLNPKITLTKPHCVSPHVSENKIHQTMLYQNLQRSPF